VVWRLTVYQTEKGELAPPATDSITRQRQLLTVLYKGSWTPAFDVSGRQWRGALPPTRGHVPTFRQCLCWTNITVVGTLLSGAECGQQLRH